MIADSPTEAQVVSFSRGACYGTCPVYDFYIFPDDNFERLTMPCIVKFGHDFKSAGYANAKKVNHGNLRDDRSSHGRDVRAYMEVLAACRRMNAMASLYDETLTAKLFKD